MLQPGTRRSGCAAQIGNLYVDDALLYAQLVVEFYQLLRRALRMDELAVPLAGDRHSVLLDGKAVDVYELGHGILSQIPRFLFQ